MSKPYEETETERAARQARLSRLGQLADADARRADPAVQAAIKRDAEDASLDELKAAENILQRATGITIAELQEDIKKYTKEKGWDDDRQLGTLLLLTVGELCEAFEEYRDWHEYNEVRVVHGKPEGIPIELADAVIRILSLCSKYNINLQEALLMKHEYNKTREHRHGGKRA